MERAGMEGTRDILAAAIEDTVAFFGPSIKDAILADFMLAKRNNENELDLLALSRCISRFFGQEWTEFILSRVFARARELYSVRNPAQSL